MAHPGHSRVLMTPLGRSPLGKRGDPDAWLDEGLRPRARRLVQMPATPRGQRIVVLGDSIAFGAGLAEEEAYPALLEGLLRSTLSDVQVANMGIPGQTVVQGWARLERHALRLRPALIIIAFGLNDMHLTRSALDAWREERFRTHTRREGGLARHPPTGRLYVAIRARVERVCYRRFVARASSATSADLQGAPRVAPDIFRTCLADMVTEAQRVCPALLLTTTPLAPHVTADRSPNQQAAQFASPQAYDDAIRQVANDAGARFVDLSALAPQGEASAFWLEDGVHLGLGGHQAVAQLLCQHVSEALAAVQAR